MSAQVMSMQPVHIRCEATGHVLWYQSSNLSWNSASAIYCVASVHLFALWGLRFFLCNRWMTTYFLTRC